MGHRKIMVSVMVLMSLHWGDEAFGGLYTDEFFVSFISVNGIQSETLETGVVSR